MKLHLLIYNNKTLIPNFYTGYGTEKLLVNDKQTRPQELYRLTYHVQKGQCSPDDTCEEVYLEKYN